MILVNNKEEKEEEIEVEIDSIDKRMENLSICLVGALNELNPNNWHTLKDWF